MIVYPLFLEFMEHSADEFWKLLYENMAYNKFPHGVYMMKDHLCCFHKGKEFSIKIDDTMDRFILFTHIHAFLINKMGIRSEKEKKEMKESIMYSQSIKDENTKRTIKDLTLTSFVIREGEKHHLSDIIIRRIFSLLIIGFMFKTILNKDVLFHENNEIRGIRGFEFDNRRVKITRDVVRIRKNQILSPIRGGQQESIKMSSHWIKYVQNLSQLGQG